VAVDIEVPLVIYEPVCVGGRIFLIGISVDTMYRLFSVEMM
jgi:hypothetical protein